MRAHRVSLPSSSRRTVVLALVCIAPLLSRAEDSIFEQRIAPLLQERCAGCHNPDKHEGELDLTTLETALKGGDEGPAFLAGKAESSRLIRMISGPKPKMPKEGAPLSAEEIADLRGWIESGARWPKQIRLKAPERKRSGPGFWSYQALARPPVPTAPQFPQGWCRTPVDNFILAKLSEKHLPPSHEAGRATLIRRLTYDLHGLPPAPEEISAFADDTAPDAYEKLVERLLASPRYGERWARHWLDVAHYGDTHGYDKDKRRNNAWPYRDYVIRAFNEDKPYAQFIREQIAGDVLVPENPDAVAATGFIAAGPWDLVGQIELAEGSTDKKITRVLDRDDMVANVASSFLSVTVHCARCHDHKFDPIPQKDYYALQAVFAGVERADRPCNETREQHARRVALENRKTELAAKRDKLTQAIAGKKSPELLKVEEDLREFNQNLAALDMPANAEKSRSNGYHSGISPAADTVKWVQVDLGKSIPLKEIRLVPARPTDFRDAPGFGFPLRFKVEISDDEKFFLSEIIDDRTAVDFPNPGDVPYVIRPTFRAARFVRVTATRLWERTHDYVFALAELQVASDGKNVAAGAPVSALDSIEAGRWSTRYLVDGFNSRARLPAWPAPPLTDGSGAPQNSAKERADLQAKIGQFEREQRRLADALIGPAMKAELAGAIAALADVEKEIKTLPKPEMVYALLPHAPREIHVLNRGNVDAPKEEAHPGALSLVKGLENEFKLADPANEGLRRAALAEWIADPKNMLTWRSIVNRVWQYHFGKGIVDSPSDFGFNGGRPSHAELLDWLAMEFLESGGSMKKLHKLIVCSAAYRQASDGSAVATARPAGLSVDGGASVDADNRLLWRMNRRRLDAESLRDSVLYISAKLDLKKMGGPGFDLFNFKDDHSPHYDYAAFAQAEHPETWRRSIYRFAVRSVPDPFMDCLDCADPNLNTPVRNNTNTALQALAMLNDPFLIRQSQYAAERIRGMKNSDPAEAAYVLLLGRPPSAEEKWVLSEYIARHGVANACRMLMNSNEFMYVD